jgi:hypothetical protein
MSEQRWSEAVEDHLIELLNEAHENQTTWREFVRTALTALDSHGLLVPDGAVRRVERGHVYQGAERLPIIVERTVWETPWLPEKIADWERELLENQVEPTHDSEGAA